MPRALALPRASKQDTRTSSISVRSLINGQGSSPRSSPHAQPVLCLAQSRHAGVSLKSTKLLSALLFQQECYFKDSYPKRCFRQKFHPLVTSTYCYATLETVLKTCALLSDGAPRHRPPKQGACRALCKPSQVAASRRSAEDEAIIWRVQVKCQLFFLNLLSSLNLVPFPRKHFPD